MAELLWELFKLKKQFNLTEKDIETIKSFSGAKTDKELVLEIEKLISEGGIK